jgi:hypothetical protein
MTNPESRDAVPATEFCTTPGCGHRKDSHAEPIRDDGHCTICECQGWDPLTAEQWRIAYEVGAEARQDSLDEVERLRRALEDITQGHTRPFLPMEITGSVYSAEEREQSRVSVKRQQRGWAEARVLTTTEAKPKSRRCPSQ